MPDEEKTAIYNSALDDPLFQAALKPYKLKLVAPASGTDPDKIRRILELPQLNIDSSCMAQSKDIIFHSHTDEMRLKQLIDVLYDESDNTLIWTLRGGYGSARLIDRLNELPKPTHEKLFIGFSDVTALHLFFSQKWHWQTLHAAGLAQILDPHLDPENFLKIAQVISKKPPELRYDLTPFNHHATQSIEINGCLTGGNLTLVENSIATSWEIQTKNKIVFLEDTGEKGYRIDRSLHHLHQAGLLNEVKAILFGEFLHNTEDNDIMIALQRFANEVSFPVYTSKHIGHGKTNYPLLYNRQSLIKPSENQQQPVLIMPL